MIFKNFCGPSYTSQSPIADNERCVNWYPELLESPGAKSSMALYPCPGLTAFASVTESPFRGLFAADGRMFGVVGYKFYEFFTDGTKTDRGDVASNSNPATICSNGDGGGQLFITSGDVGYCFNLGTNTLTTELASGATMGAFLDGFFLCLDTATSTLQISALNDGTTWDATQIAQRTAGADKWKAMFVVHREIWLMGSQTSEVWYNAGLSPFPFAPIPGGFLEHGTISAFSGARLGSALVWLGANDQGAGVVYRANGYLPERISNHAVEFAIQSYTTITDAVSFAYQDQGHNFCVLTFPNAGATWAYDDKTGQWHERLYWNTGTAAYEAYRPMFHTYAFGKHLVGDRATGSLYEMSVDVYTDVGAALIRRLRRTPHVHAEQRLIRYHDLTLDMQVGIGLVSGQGSDPQVMLRWSNDGGMTWSNEHWITAGGAIGQYGVRVSWNRLGVARDRVFEVVTTDPVPWRLVGALLNVSVGAH